MKEAEKGARKAVPSRFGRSISFGGERLARGENSVEIRNFSASDGVKLNCRIRSSYMLLLL